MTELKQPSNQVRELIQELEANGAPYKSDEANEDSENEKGFIYEKPDGYDTAKTFEKTSRFIGSDIKRNKRNVLLLGKSGTGKTSDAHYIAHRYGMRCKFVRWYDVFTMTNWDDRVNEYQTLVSWLYPVIILDDVKKLNQSGQEMLQSIIDKRTEKNQFTIITSNVTSNDELIDWYGAPIYDRFFSSSWHVIKYDRESLR